MAEKYYSILTNRGKELEAQSSATGKPVIIKDFVVGDGNGQAVTPDPARTSLVKEVYRGAISALQIFTRSDKPVYRTAGVGNRRWRLRGS